MSPSADMVVMQYTYWIILLFYPVTMLTKISVCTGYLWLFPGKKNKIFCYAMIGYSILYGVTLFFAHVFQCKSVLSDASFPNICLFQCLRSPVSVFWEEPFDPGTICINKLALYVTAATLNSLGDLLIYLWPVWFLFRLQMPLKHRLGLIVLFSFGCCVLTASLMRIAYLPASLKSIDIFCKPFRLLGQSLQNADENQKITLPAYISSALWRKPLALSADACPLQRCCSNMPFLQSSVASTRH